MFTDCASLVGGNGTKYSSSHTNGEITWQGKFSDEYHDIIVLKPELDAYVKKWCEKDVPTKSTLD